MVSPGWNGSFQAAGRREGRMTSYMWPSDKSAASYESSVWMSSEVEPGVRFLIQRMSLERKIELTRKIREIGRKVEFLESSDDPRQQLEAVALVNEIDRAYLTWGLAAIEGLTIDGALATPETLLEKGPLRLSAEALSFVKSECGLTDAERKN